MASRLVLALDETDPARALDIAREVAPFVAKIKINYPLVLTAGLNIVTEISKLCPVICDFKVADIPNTNRLISEAVFNAGASGIIAHAFPGSESLKAIKDVDNSKDLYVVITMSHPKGGEFFDIERFCSIALEIGATGVVAPATRPEDVSRIRELVGNLEIISIQISLSLTDSNLELMTHMKSQNIVCMDLTLNSQIKYLKVIL